MNVVGIAANFYALTFQAIADAAKVGMEFGFYRGMYKRLPVFGAKYEVYVVFYE